MRRADADKKMDEETKKQVEEIALKVVRNYNKVSFTERKTTDTPTDAFSLVNRRFVTLSSNIGARPVSSVAIVGQRFFNTTASVPIWYTTAGWVNSVGSIVAINN